ncbi:MAG: NgoFVII family restriction endonuclease [Sulfurimonas sp.]|nr:NgoFVII family restriction endonuclease [Sulfurimonas sp.]
MELLTTPIEIQNKLCLLMNSYKNISFATAWASANSKAFNILNKNKNKIHKIVVGIHFYQTNPNFIKEFINNEKVKFITNPTGIFHPKIYLFSNDENDWQCLIGSANFTKAAMEKNTEIMTCINSSDIGSNEIYNKLISEIESYHQRATIFSNDDLIAYQKIWDKKLKSRDDLQDKFNQDDDVKPIYKSNVITLNWDDFFNKVKNDKNNSFTIRLELLKKAKEYFLNKKFKEISETKRLNIAGITKWGEGNINWHYFGNMGNARIFANGIKIDERIDNLSDALEYIPLNGIITRKNYFDFLDAFIDKKRGWGYGVATVSRILAIKRPDVFFCLTKGNGKLLYKDFGIKKEIKTHEYKRYWEEIIERIHKSDWFDSEKPNDQVEELLWNNRVAMLDAIFYDDIV